jgi:putative nucleotidyltransferase with HDIG domain
MKNEEYLKLKKVAFDLLIPEMTKEYQCHVQFVVKIAVDLAKKMGADVKIVEIAALFHDVGRGKEKENEEHPESGARIVEEIIDRLTPDILEKEIILNCIKNHSGKKPVTTTEEKIIITADGASKIIYHQAFMLMCKKESFEERAAWGLKHLEKDINKIIFSEFKKEIEPIYKKYREIYGEVITSSYLNDPILKS